MELFFLKNGQNTGSEKNIIYIYISNVNLTREQTQKIYYGGTEGEFKYRYNNHTKSFRNEIYKNDSELSKYIWQLKDKNIEFQITWETIRRASKYQSGSRKCDLCATEKLYIIEADPSICLNNRNEITTKCRHQNKFLLRNWKPP